MVAGLLVSLAVSVLALVGNQSLSNKSLPLKGVTNYDEISDGALAHKTLSLSIPKGSATSTAFVQNLDKFTRWITVQAVSDATSSAQAYRIYMGTTTQPATSITGSGSALVVPLFLSPGNAPFLNGWLLATSSSATSTDSWSVFGSAGRASDKVALLPWRQNEYLYVLLQNASGADVPGQFSATNTTVKPQIDVFVTIQATSTDNNTR